MDLSRELEQLRTARPGRTYHAWYLWEAVRLAPHYARFHLTSPRTLPWGHGLLQDLHFAFRSLRRHAVYSAVTIVTLGLGIGTVTAMFSVVNGVLLESVPFDDPDQLVNVWLTSEGARGAPGLVGRTWDRLPLSLMEYRSWQASNEAFQGVAVHNGIEATLSGNGPAERVPIGFGSASLLSVLGTVPAMGRWFLPGEEGTGSADAAAVAVISHETWQSRFGSDPDILEESIVVDGAAYRIIGVLPSGFRLRHLGMHWLGEDTSGFRDVWLPLGAPGLRNGNNLEAIARLRSRMPIEQARAEASRILMADRPSGEVRIVPRSNDETEGLGYPLVLLLGATGFLLLIACANIATVSLGELSGREGELSTRHALGARRTRIVRQLLTESLVLGGLGAVGGVLIAVGGTKALVAVAPPLPRLEAAGVDARALLFATAIGVASAFLFGTFPAWRAARNAAAGGSARARTRGWERWIVSFEIALTTVLLVSGGLLGRSLQNLFRVDPGFDASSLATVEVHLPESRYPTGRDVESAYDELITRVSAIPGVTGATAITRLPFPGLTNTSTMVATGPSGEDITFTAQQLFAMPGYHEFMRIPLIEGADLQRDSGSRDMLISENIARRFWPDESPVGARVGSNLTIVGVVGNVKRNTLGADADQTFYMPLWDQMPRGINVVARTQDDVSSLTLEMRETVREFDPDVPVVRAATMASLIAESTRQEGYRVLLMGIFGILGTLLAAVGIFGVTARAVVQRGKELSVRMALGAARRTLMAAELKRGLTTGAVGALAGLLGAIWSGRLLSGLLFGVEPWDPVTQMSVTGGLLLVVVIASYLPARTISALDPARGLKSD